MESGIQDTGKVGAPELLPTCNSILVNTSRNTSCTGKSISISPHSVGFCPETSATSWSGENRRQRKGEAVTKEKEFRFCFTTIIAARFNKTFKLIYTQGHSRGIPVSRPCENAENILLNQDMSRCSIPKNPI